MSPGKRLYKTSALPSVKWLTGTICIVLFANLYFKTFFDDDYTALGPGGFTEFIYYHLKYPGDILAYVFFVFIPSFYYAFVRGIIFYEKGMTLNRGLPFFNIFVPYEKISEYSVLNSKYLMSIKRKDTEEVMLFTVCYTPRVVSIFDQRHIPGNFPKNQSDGLSKDRKVAYAFAIGVGIILLVLQYLGLFKNVLKINL